MKKVFIDGKEGTTGLRIFERLENRKDIQLITLKEENRKDLNARKSAINSADIVFLCLPDEVSKEAVSMAKDDVVIIDASTAHRTKSEWAYGLPELGEEQENKIKNSYRIAVPGCHASGFITLVQPLVKHEIIEKDCLLTCHSITGYSGGGKKMIADYENSDDSLLKAPRQYGLSQNHKHLSEMKIISGLSNEPIFCPIVSNFYSGMVVTVPLFKSNLSKGKSVEDIKKLYQEKYNSDIVKYVDCIDEQGFISANTLNGKDSMQVTVLGNEERILLVARYDNLGKGASGAAIECMNISMNIKKSEGLNL